MRAGRRGRRGRAHRGHPARPAQRALRVAVVGELQLSRRMPRARRVGRDHAAACPITPGEVVLLSSYFALLTGGDTRLLMLLPHGHARHSSRCARSPRSLHGARPRAQRGQARSSTRWPGRSRSSTSSSATPTARRPALDDVDLDIAPGRDGRASSARRARASRRYSTSRSASSAPGGPGAARRRDMARPSTCARSGASSRSCRRSRCCSRAPSATTSPTGSDDVARRPGAPALRARERAEIVEALPDGWDTVVGGARRPALGRPAPAARDRARARARPRGAAARRGDRRTRPASPRREVAGALERSRGRTTLVVAHRPEPSARPTASSCSSAGASSSGHPRGAARRRAAATPA